MSINFTNPPPEPTPNQPKSGSGLIFDSTQLSPYNLPRGSWNFPKNPNPNIKFKYDLNIVDLAQEFGLNMDRLINPFHFSSLQQGGDMITVQGEQSELPTSSYFGLPVFGRLTLSVNTKNFTKSVNLDNCWVTINQKKNIIKTPVNGYRGTIHEILSIFDYDIKIEGIHAGETPENYGPLDTTKQDILNDFIAICNWSSDVNISHIMTDKVLTTKKIIIDEVEFNQSKDYSNLVYFKIMCCDSSILPVAY